MWSEFISRIGTFCILIGVGMLLLFVASDASGSANFDLLFWSLLVIAAGILLGRRKPPAPRSGRFSMLQRFRHSPRKGKEDR
jgi:hypothetical protein